MSKLSDMIRAEQTNERRAVISPLVEISIRSEELPLSQSCPMHYVYQMQAKFGCSAVVSTGGRDAQQKLKLVRQQVVEDIFGEFRKDIYAIQRALFERDVDTAVEAVGKLFQNMYEV